VKQSPQDKLIDERDVRKGISVANGPQTYLFGSRINDSSSGLAEVKIKRMHFKSILVWRRFIFKYSSRVYVRHYAHYGTRVGLLEKDLAISSLSVERVCDLGGVIAPTKEVY